jgi:prepilin-type processing-associated H-X9-DG protein
VQAAREAARRSQCVNNLKQMGLALHNYLSTYNTFPAGRPGDDPNNNDSNAMSTWVSVLGPLDQQSMFNAYNFSLSWNDPSVSPVYAASCIPAANTTVGGTNLAVFTCPTDIRKQPYVNTTTSGRNDIPKVAQIAISSYATCAGVLGANNTGADTFGMYSTSDVKHLNDGFADYGFPKKIKAFVDGTSNTIAVGETAYDNDGSWYGTQIAGCSGFNPMFNAWSVNLRMSSNFRVTKNPLNTLPGIGYSAGGLCGTNAAFGSYHPGGGNFLFVDGSVHYLKNTINLPVYYALSTRNEGEIVSADAY